jgi:hypothetical protein
MKFTTEQLLYFEAYEQVRESAEYNMFDLRAAQAAGLTRDQHIFVMENYNALKLAFQAAQG